ncbi:MAG: cmk [Candidatus Nomurabacteria bacterium]|nr:cmk [Candidatus Nomurabacteria bacterium]
MNSIPIIAIDGTSSSGKGTIAYKLAEYLGLNYLNSGALFRLAGHLAVVSGIDIHDHSDENMNKIVDLLLKENLDLEFIGKKVIHNGVDIWPILSSEDAGVVANTISFYPPLRDAINDFQRKRVSAPGLVDEGRDVGTTVFPNANVKIYLDASVEARAKRRLVDEQKRGSGKTYEILCAELAKRDEVDKAHKVGALKVADDALYIDTSDLTIEQVLEKCINHCKEKGIVKS